MFSVDDKMSLSIAAVSALLHARGGATDKTVPDS